MERPADAEARFQVEVLELPPPRGRWAGGHVTSSGFWAYLERGPDWLHIVTLSGRRDVPFLRQNDHTNRRLPIRVHPDGTAIAIRDGDNIWWLDAAGEVVWTRPFHHVADFTFCRDRLVVAELEGGNAGPITITSLGDDGVPGEVLRSEHTAFDLIITALGDEVFIDAPHVLQALWSPISGAQRDVPYQELVLVASARDASIFTISEAASGSTAARDTLLLHQLRVHDPSPTYLGLVSLPLPLWDAGGGCFASLIDGRHTRSWELHTVVDEM